MRLSRRTLLRGACAGATVGLALPPLEAMLNSRGAHADPSDDGPIFGIFYWANGLPWHAGHGAEQGQGGYPDEWTPAAPYGNDLHAEPAPRASREPSGERHQRARAAHRHSGQPTRSGRRSHARLHGRADLGSRSPRRVRSPLAHADGAAPVARPVRRQARRFLRDAAAAFPLDRPRSERRAFSRVRPLERHLLQRARLDEPAHHGSGPALRSSVRGAGRRGHVDPAGAAARHGDGRRGRPEEAPGAGDRLRVDAHLAHLDEIQRRLELGVLTCEAPSPPLPTSDLHEKTSIMAELLAVALGCGLTRVFSFMLTSPATTHVFGNLGVADGMHKSCHDGDWADVRNITLYHMQAFARFMDELQAVTSPTGGTLMDRALIYGASEYGEGWKHGEKEHPVVIAGGAAGRIQRGIHAREAGGNLSKAHVTMLRALEIDTPSYGFNGGETSDDFPELLA